MHFPSKITIVVEEALKSRAEGGVRAHIMELAEIFGKLMLACVLGGVIGYEREARHNSEGLRTNILVCLGSCLVMMISVDIGDGSGVDAAVTLYTTRRECARDIQALGVFGITHGPNNVHTIARL